MTWQTGHALAARFGITAWLGIGIVTIMNKHLQEQCLRINIAGSIQAIFNFCLNPSNSPAWIDGIAEEKTDTWPPALGTVYRNRAAGGEWATYELTAYDPPNRFVLSKVPGNFHVEYRFLALDPGLTEFTYREWVDDAWLESPFDMANLEKLKALFESTGS
jgi:hypothetical protein